MRFVYDKNLTDRETNIRLSVTVVETDSDILISLKAGGLSQSFFLKPDTAMQLAAALTNAVCAYDRANEVAETKTSETYA